MDAAVVTPIQRPIAGCGLLVSDAGRYLRSGAFLSREDLMKRSNILLLVVLATASAHASSTASGSTARSGLATTATPIPEQFAGNAALQACADQLFANGLDDATNGACGNGSAGVYTDRAAFIAALAPGYIKNGFDDVAHGASGGLNYAEAGFEYLVYTQFGASGALYNGAGFVSTDRVSDKIVIYFFGGAPVTAIGGNVWSSDFSLRPTAGTITLRLDNGTTETLSSNGPDDFRGFIADAPIFSLTIDAPDATSPPPGASPDRWPTLDELIIGNGP